MIGGKHPNKPHVNSQFLNQSCIKIVVRNLQFYQVDKVGGYNFFLSQWPIFSPVLDGHSLIKNRSSTAICNIQAGLSCAEKTPTINW